MPSEDHAAALAEIGDAEVRSEVVSLLAHSGEALDSRQAFQNLPKYDQDSLIEFLKTLQVLPPGTKDRIVDENFKAREWPPNWAKGASDDKEK